MTTDFTVLKNARLAFDLDGTLVDTAPDLVRALNETLAQEGLEPVNLQEVRAMVGRGAAALIEQAYQYQGRAVPEGDSFKDLINRFLDHYQNGLCDTSKPFDGVEETLDKLMIHGAKLSVCTNKPKFLAAPLLDMLGLSSRFERIIGPDETPAKKPNRQHLETAINGLADAKTILVGDSQPDALAAQNAGAGCILFKHGYSQKPIHTLGADRLFDNWADLAELIAQLISERVQNS